MRTLLLLGLLSLVAATPAAAAHYHLKADGSGAYANIQAAVNAAASGDTIFCADGTYTGTGNTDIDFGGKNLILRSENNQPKNCVIDCSSGDRGFYFHSSETASAIVQGFTIRDGGATNGGGISIVSSSPTIVNCVIDNCSASDGGGIYINNASANPGIFNCVISNCTAYGDGGGIRLYYCDGQVRNCTIVSNTCSGGAGGISSQGGSADVVDNIIYWNFDNEVEGAFYGLFNHNLIEGYTGGGGFDGDASFVSGAGGNYYLNQTLSDAVDAGSVLATAACYPSADGSLCMSGGWTTKTNQQEDLGQVDVGYHYPHYGAAIDVPSYRPTIQAAIDAAWNGDNVRVSDGTYTGDGNRDLDTKGKRITVQSMSTNANACVIDCQGSAGSPHRGFYIRKGEGPQTLIKNMKIINGWGSYGGGINISGCSPTIQGCIFSGNHATVDGGGIMNSQGNSDIIGCTFYNNTADDAGGGILNHTCAPTISGCVFDTNVATWGGGGIYNYYASPSVEGCTFRYNVTQHWGGGVHNQNGNSPATLTYSDCLFQENTSGETGGGMYNRASAAPILTNCTFRGNETATYGGAIYCTGASSPQILSCTIYGNMATGGSSIGGGIYSTGSSPYVENTLIIHNYSEGTCGGYYCAASDASDIRNCTFYDNSGRSGSGAFYALSSSPVLIRNIFWQDVGPVGAEITLDATTAWVQCCDVQGGESAGFRLINGGSIYHAGAILDADPIFCHADRNDFTIHSTSPCAAANSGGCFLIGARDVGCTQTDVTETPPAANRLYQSYPNPFNPTTRIAFDLAAAGPVSIDIFDVSGRLVRTLVERALTAGRHDVTWDGTDRSGSKVASGAYFCRMTAGSFSQTMKMVLLR